MFLSLSFAVAFTLSQKEEYAKGLFYCYAGIPLAIVVVLLWRKSLKCFLNRSKIWILLLFINLVISGYAIVKSINLVINTDESKQKTESPIQNNTEIKNQRYGKF
jgi:uncharacterized membrane protein